ncbi:HD domain-containing protein, partial [Streptococcus sp. DD11]
MLLIHDLGEVYAGDTFVFDEEGKADSYSRELAS